MALYLAALIMFLLANTFPFVALRYGDRIEQSLLISGGFALQNQGMPEIGLLVLLTSVVFPFLTICGMLYLLLPRRLGFRLPWTTAIWRMVRAISPWSLMGVFMLGLLVSILIARSRNDCSRHRFLFVYCLTGRRKRRCREF